MLLFIFWGLFHLTIAKEENVLTTEVFEIPIKPPLFNWTYDTEEIQYVYQPSLANAPDLPPWLSYTYSKRHRAGFLYGVPPNKNNAKFPIEIVALNRKDYTTRHAAITVRVTEKRRPAKHEVVLKIDNLNVEDVFDVETVERLKDVFRKQLWRESRGDLCLTFLTSAVELGARKPLNPTEGEGVVLRLGSVAPLSMELRELQEEVRPIWKVPNCPRISKRTSVERYFRDAGFSIDWCAFRLLGEETAESGTNVEKLSNLDESQVHDRWSGVTKESVPQRSYNSEFLFTVLVPLVILILMALLLSFILCFHHEGIEDPVSEEYFDNIFHICLDYARSQELKKTPCENMNQYATIHKATQSLRSLSNNRDEFACLSPESVLISRSHTNSPTSTINRGVHCRPSPPPYVRPIKKPDF